MSGTNSIAASATLTEDHSENEADIDLSPATSGKVLAVATFSRRRKCYYCGRRHHRRADCPAKEVSCHSCEKVGHFSRVCKSKGKKPLKKPSEGQGSALSSHNPSPLFRTYAAACPGSLIKASLGVSVNGIKLTALVDSGSNKSYINPDSSQKLGLKPIPSNHNVQKASAAMKMKSSGFCVVDVAINGKKHEATRLNVLDNLCSDIILGLDFQSQHHRLFGYNQIFHYTRCNTPKRVTSWQGPFPHHCARETQLLSKKCCSGGEPLATLCPI